MPNNYAFLYPDLNESTETEFLSLGGSLFQSDTVAGKKELAR